MKNLLKRMANVKHICKNCKKIFYGDRERRYCSKKCYFSSKECRRNNSKAQHYSTLSKLRKMKEDKEYDKKIRLNSSKANKKAHKLHPDLASRMGKSTQQKHPNLSSQTLKKTIKNWKKNDFEGFLKHQSKAGKKGGKKNLGQKRPNISKVKKELYKDKRNHPCFGKKQSKKTINRANRTKKKRGVLDRFSERMRSENPMYDSKTVEKTRTALIKYWEENNPYWPKEKVNYLIQNYLKKRDEDLAKGLNKTRRAIRHKRIKLKLIKSGNLFAKGKNNHTFNNWSSFEPYSPNFNERTKQYIYQAYGRNCYYPECRKKADCIHHIDYNKKNSKDNNLIPLCNVHNGSVNSKYERDEWRKIFKSMILLKEIKKFI